MKQIDMIAPTVIICCGKDSVIECLKYDKKNYTIKVCGESVPIINAYHPQRTSTEKFYYNTLNVMKERGIFEKQKNAMKKDFT